MEIITAVLFLALVIAVVIAIRAREANATLTEAVARLEQERDAARAEKPKLTEFSATLENLGSSLKRAEERDADATQLLAQVKTEVAHGNERIDTLVGRWSNPKQRSQLGEAWLVGALKRMGLGEGLHFDVQKRIQILGRRGTKEGVIDVLLHLPNGNGLALDSKFPWAGHLHSLLDGQADARDFAMRKLRDALRSHVKDIAGREYHCAEGIDVRHVLVVVPDWQTLDLVKRVDPQIGEFAADHGVGLVPTDGLYEIAAALGELHREEGWGEKIRELFSPADADRMYSACVDLLERVECVIKRHNSSGDAISELAAAFGPNGLMARDVLGPANRTAEKVEIELKGEAKGVDGSKVVRHRNRLETQQAELPEATRPEAA